eukprot:m.235553 g.235553  ORF g.235553 m.235553 type:complete len:197 (+) comp15761_c0_seq9:2884-3474(+)
MGVSDGGAAGIAIGFFVIGVAVGALIHKWQLCPCMSKRIRFDRKPFLPGLELKDRLLAHDGADYTGYEEPVVQSRGHNYEAYEEPAVRTSYETYTDVAPRDTAYTDVSPRDTDSFELIANSEYETHAADFDSPHSYENVGRDHDAFRYGAAAEDPLYADSAVTDIVRQRGDPQYVNTQAQQAGSATDSVYEEVQPL